MDQEIEYQKQHTDEKESSIYTIVASVLVICLLFIALEYLIISIIFKISKNNILIQENRNYKQSNRNTDKYTDLFFRFAPLGRKKQKFFIELSANRKKEINNIDLSYHFTMNLTESFYVGRKKEKEITINDLQTDLDFYENNLTSSSLTIFDDYVQNFDSFQINLLIKGDVAKMDKWNIFYSYTNPNLIHFLEILTLIIAGTVLIATNTTFKGKKHKSNIMTQDIVLSLSILFYINPLGLIIYQLQSKFIYISFNLLFTIFYRNTVVYLLKTLVPSQKNVTLLSKLHLILGKLLFFSSFINPLLNCFFSLNKENMLFIRYESYPKTSMSRYSFYVDFVYYFILFSYIVIALICRCDFEKNGAKKSMFNGNFFILICYFILFFIEFSICLLSFFFMMKKKNNLLTSFVCNVAIQTAQIFSSLVLMFMRSMPSKSAFTSI